MSASSSGGQGALASNSFSAERRRRTPTRIWCTLSALSLWITPASLPWIWARQLWKMASMASATLPSRSSVSSAALWMRVPDWLHSA